MGTVAEFVESGDAAWDVTKVYDAAVIEMQREIKEHTHVMIVMTDKTVALVDRKQVRIKVVSNESTRDSE